MRKTRQRNRPVGLPALRIDGRGNKDCGGESEITGALICHPQMDSFYSFFFFYKYFIPMG